MLGTGLPNASTCPLTSTGLDKASRQHLYAFEPIPTVELPDRLPVLDQLGSFLMWVDEHTARKLIKERKAMILRQKRGRGKIIGLMAIPDPDLPPDKHCSRKTYFGLPHRRETEDNPANVWTQDKMGSTHKGIPNGYARWARDVCKQVMTDCIVTEKKAA